MTKLLADNIIDHIRMTQNGESSIKDYFRTDPLMQAIIKNISYEKDSLIEYPANHSVVFYRGTGANVRLKDVTVWGTQFRQIGNHKHEPYELDYFGVEISVEYNDDDDQCITQSYTLFVPIDLELNFTQEKFDTWVIKVKAERKLKQKEKDRKNFDILIAKYPEWNNNAAS